MPKLRDNQVPSYRHHRQSGQAIVTLNGRDILLGPHGTAASRAEYNRRVAEWLANGRSLPTSAPELTISELIEAFRQHAVKLYAGSDEHENYRQACRPLRKLYGPTTAADFGPLKLEAVRNAMIALGWCRNVVNRQIGRIKHVFKWGVSREMIPPSVYQALSAVAGIRKHQGEAVESEPVQPVADDVVNATVAHLSPTVAAMVQFQRLTGTRPGEICGMRIGDIDRKEPVWTYTPTSHKTAHHDQRRIICIGPKAQAVLNPFILKVDPAAYIFSPREAVAEMRRRRADARTTPRSCGNVEGSNRKQRPARTPAPSYDGHAYRRAIARATDLADKWAKCGIVIDNDERVIPQWHPNQLRHTAATDIRQQFGIEAAQHVLGHAKLNMTELYAQKNADVAKRIAAAIG